MFSVQDLTTIRNWYRFFNWIKITETCLKAEIPAIDLKTFYSHKNILLWVWLKFFAVLLIVIPVLLLCIIFSDNIICYENVVKLAATSIKITHTAVVLQLITRAKHNLHETLLFWLPIGISIYLYIVMLSRMTARPGDFP